MYKKKFGLTSCQPDFLRLNQSNLKKNGDFILNSYVLRKPQAF